MKKFSNEHVKYLRNLKRKNILIFVCQLLLFILFIIVWQVLAKYKIINTFLFSSPINILKTFLKLVSTGDLYMHVFVTLYEVIISFVISSFIGITIAALLWLNDDIARIFDPYLTVLNSLPKVALGPLIIIWVGASIKSIIFMSLLISTFITIINVYNGFKNTNKTYILLLKSLGAKKFQLLSKVIFPANYGIIFNSLKVNISMCLIGVVMGELLVSKRGIGYLINYGSQVFNINLVITGVVILGIISCLMYFFISRLEAFFYKN